MTLNYDKVLFTSVKTRPNFDALYQGKGFQPPLNLDLRNRVWKGICGILDLAKIRCGNRTNDKYLDGNRDLTAHQEVGLNKI